MKRETKAEFIKRMKATAKSICRQYGIECKGELSEACAESTFADLKVFIRFYVSDKRTHRLGEIDLMSEFDSFKITLGGKTYANGEIKKAVVMVRNENAPQTFLTVERDLGGLMTKVMGLKLWDKATKEECAAYQAAYDALKAALDKVHKIKETFTTKED